MTRRVFWNLTDESLTSKVNNYRAIGRIEPELRGFSLIPQSPEVLAITQVSILSRSKDHGRVHYDVTCRDFHAAK